MNKYILKKIIVPDLSNVYRSNVPIIELMLESIYHALQFGN